MMRRFGLAVLVLALVCAVAAGDEVVLTATDSKCIDPSGTNWNDNRLRAYWNNRHVDGFVKFDFTEIPDNATITAMTLTTYHEEGFGNPRNDPEVKIYRVADDSWSRGPIDPHPGLNEVLTGIHKGFPSGDLIPYDWELDVKAADWRQDLDDDVLSLGMREEKLSYSYVYWHGADPNPKPPILTVTFSSGCGNRAKLKSNCKKGGAKVIGKLKKATPNTNVTFKLDGGQEKKGKTNNKGKAKGKWKNQQPGKHTVSVCDLEKGC